MPRRALAEKRPFLLAAIAAAMAFYYLRAGPWPEMWLIPLKGAGLVLLAGYAWLRHASREARLLAGMMIAASCGEMAYETGLTWGRFAYFVYHVAALSLYLPNRRAVLTGSQKAAVTALLLVPPLIYAALGGAGGELAEIAYGLAAGAMAAAAWSSAFPRYRVGAGAVLVLAADMLLTAGQGPLNASHLPQILAWPLSFFGHLLVCTGVMQTLRKRDPQLKLVRSS